MSGDISNTTQSFSWQCQGQSVLGASHQRSGAPNQDAIAWWPDPGSGPPAVLAISDGHGSAKSFRSQRGSAMAVQMAIAEVCQSFRLRPSATRPGQLQLDHADLDLNEAKSIAGELPQRLVQRWQQLVMSELQTYPVTPAEWERLQTREGTAACQRVRQQPLIAYGATILIFLVTDHFICYWQLGDGDILCVDAQGQVSRPLTKDQQLVANATNSLCQEKIWPEMRWCLQPVEQQPPELILLSTDGYANSFVTEADFQQIGPDYLQMLQEQGLAQVMEQLPTILQQASQRGSGDDITLGCLLRQPALQPTAVEPFAEQQSPNSTPLQTGWDQPSQIESAHPLVDPHGPEFPVLIPNPVTLPDPELEGVAEKPVSTIAELLQLNRQHVQALSRLRLWLRLMLGVTLLSLGLASFSFWQLHNRQPSPSMNPNPHPPKPGIAEPSQSSQP
jgi:hypothetical protein